MNNTLLSFLHLLPKIILLGSVIMLMLLQTTSVREQQITNELLTIIAKNKVQKVTKLNTQNKGEVNEIN